MSTTATAADATGRTVGWMDVTDRAMDDLRAYARDATADLHLERRGGRTYLIADD
jgi:hypothetical protein